MATLSQSGYCYPLYNLHSLCYNGLVGTISQVAHALSDLSFKGRSHLPDLTDSYCAKIHITTAKVVIIIVVN